jgi:hypothetical protein
MPVFFSFSVSRSARFFLLETRRTAGISSTLLSLASICLSFSIFLFVFFYPTRASDAAAVRQG